LMIETHRLTKHFGRRPALRDVSLAVPRGCAFGLLGHNGAGKTTLIRMLLGLTRPDSGAIRLAGHRIPEQAEQALARVGAIVEEPHFHGHLTGRENLRIHAAVRGPQALERIDPTLARVGLLDRAEERVRGYSQGMRQRLGIARCLLADPQLVILDEPMNGLDPAGIIELRSTIAEFVAEGRTVLVSSHQLDEIEKTCHAAAVIDRGRLIAQGPINELLGGDRVELDIGCDDPANARLALDCHPAVKAVRQTTHGIRVTIADQNSAAAINAQLMQAGIAVLWSSPARASLEDRFLQITSRVGDRP
jgi:ABC-2 type transport system ATP-binding protein